MAHSKTSHWQKIALIFFGLCLTVILLEAGLRISGFILLSLQEHRNALSIRQKGNYHILCLGESTTFRQYPPFLEEILNQRNIGIKFSVIDKGIQATSTAAIALELKEHLDKYKPHMVVTMMGINDYGTHIPYETVSHSEIILFLRSFRTYKLTNLLWLHFVTTAKERRFFYPKSNKPQSILRSLYTDQTNIVLAEDSFKKALELNPKNDMAYVGLGFVYDRQGKLSLAEDSFKKALELNPLNDRVYLWLADVYFRQNKFFQAEEVLKKALELKLDNDGLQGALSTVYSAEGNHKLAEEYFKKANELRMRYYLPFTVNNYRRVKETLDKRGIRLVCVQYPMRSVESLKKIFEDQYGIIFVDNEKIFKEAVAKDGFREYFTDAFAGDFGHCTKKGNELLAENIANTILKEVFSK